MSASLRSVIEFGGFDLTTKEDCTWLIATQLEYEQLIKEAEERLEVIEEQENAEEEAN